MFEFYNIKSLAFHYKVSYKTAWLWCKKGYFITHKSMGINVIPAVQVRIVDEVGHALYPDLEQVMWPKLVYYYFKEAGEYGRPVSS